MGRVRDILGRFRPAGAPGSAAIAGVPADRVAELRAELEPVFALLADLEAEVAEILSDGQDRAESRRNASVERQDQVLADARQQAVAVRAEVAAHASASVFSEEQAAQSAAQREADQVGEHAAERLPVYVQRVTVLVLGAGAEREPVAQVMGEKPR